MQGCPLSAVLFLIVIDLLPWLLSSAVVTPGFGHVFTAADDIAIAPDGLELLFWSYPATSRIRDHSSLSHREGTQQVYFRAVA